MLYIVYTYNEHQVQETLYLVEFIHQLPSPFSIGQASLSPHTWSDEFAETYLVF